MMSCDIAAIAAAFRPNEKILLAEPFGEGHINDTYAVTFQNSGNSACHEILQRINTHVFTDPAGLMRNICQVTKFLGDKIRANGGDPLRETLAVENTADGKSFYTDKDGGCWRMYPFIEGTISCQKCRCERDFYECGVSFGNFQRMLADYPTEKLVETIPDFHNTRKRFETFKQAVRDDVAGRVKEADPEIRFAMDREAEAGEIVAMLEDGRLPKRVTHNDTKLNNILLDAKTGRGVCVIDLDTVMPGAACYDFGDCIRFGASTAAEDETDLSKVRMSLPLYKVFTEGYLSVAGPSLTPEEIDSLPVGAKLMTFECGMRFLTDFLSGDTYFKISRPNQNLDRCRTQFKLVADMETKMPEMRAIVRNAAFGENNAEAAK